MPKQVFIPRHMYDVAGSGNSSAAQATRLAANIYHDIQQQMEEMQRKYDEARHDFDKACIVQILCGEWNDELLVRFLSNLDWHTISRRKQQLALKAIVSTLGVGLLNDYEVFKVSVGGHTFTVEVVDNLLHVTGW